MWLSTALPSWARSESDRVIQERIKGPVTSLASFADKIQQLAGRERKEGL